MEITVKAFLQRQDSTTEVRRILFDATSLSTKMGGLFKLLCDNLTTSFPALKEKSFDLTWKDSEGDFILMSSDEELLEALTAARGDILKVYITETGKAAPEEGKGSNKGSSNTSAPDDETSTPLYSLHPPFMPPPPPPGMFPGNAFPPHDFPFGTGMPFVPPPPPHPGMHGHPFMPGMHHFGHPFGSHPHKFGMGRHGVKKWCSDRHATKTSCEEQEKEANAKGGKCERRCDKEWKKMLRDQVPVAHRRWAKAYIIQWRQTNIENATSTTSSDAEKTSANTAASDNIPEGYAKWLDLALQKMHKRFAGEKACIDWKEFQTFKAEVPMEFKKWCRWYIRKHFAPKSAPVFKAEKTEGEAAESNKWKKERRGNKKDLKNAVPVEHRIWTKSFIKQWRQDHVPNHEETTLNSSESDGELLPAGTTEVNIPVDYLRWLRAVLNKMHRNRCLPYIPDSDVDFKDMWQFKDTVPMEYRKWARNYYTRHYFTSGKKRCADQPEPARDAQRYQRWLLAFQKQWLDTQQQGTVTDSTTSDSEDEGGPSLEKTEQSAAAGGASDVFDLEQLRKVIDMSDGSETEGEEHSSTEKQKIPKEFRQWARTALNDWDGLTVPSDTQGESKAPLVARNKEVAEVQSHPEALAAENGENSEIPAPTLAWMMRVMARAQARKMKAAMKAGKKQMKEQKKEAKHAIRAMRKSAKAARNSIKFRYV